MNEFPHTITFEKQGLVPDGSGGYTQGWTSFLTTEAFVDPLSGSQRYQAQQLENPVNAQVYYPYQDGVTASMRVNYDGKIYKIQSEPIDQGGQGEILMVDCLL